MTRTKTLARMLAAALAIPALAAPAAVARPIDGGPLNVERAVSQSPQDLRSPDAVDAGKPLTLRDLRSPDAVEAGTPVSPQDLRSADAVQAGKPVTPLPTESVLVEAGDGDGTPWSTIGLAIAGACLALAGTAATAGRIRRRTARAGVAA